MNFNRFRTIYIFLLMLFALMPATPGLCDPFDPIITYSGSSINVLIGDVNGFGLGIPSGGTAPMPTATQLLVSPAMQTGAGGEFTDSYVKMGTPFDVAFPFPMGTTLVSGRWTVNYMVAAGSTDNELKVYYGFSNPLLLQANLFGTHAQPESGKVNSVVSTFVLDDAALALANDPSFSGFLIRIDNSESHTLPIIAYDYFLFEGELKQTVPEPATMLLLGFGLIGLAGVRRKFKV